jgi:hypothetical protein
MNELEGLLETIHGNAPEFYLEYWTSRDQMDDISSMGKGRVSLYLTLSSPLTILVALR